MKLVKLAVIIVSLVISVSLVRSIVTVLGVKDRLRQAQEEVASLQKKQADLEARLVEATSSTTIEKVLRDKLGLAKSNEYVVVLPDNPELLRNLSPELNKEEIESEPVLPTWQKWLVLFF
ncbi:septum formation initiator family protein [Candidatus Microgenomates bacterium]|nr:septum formation initiator family protein [Candidatus Microgenomates bacterium]